MKGLDTNVLVRYLTQDDPRQSRRANAVIEDDLAGDGRLHVDTVVLCELVWVLRAAFLRPRPGRSRTAARDGSPLLPMMVARFRRKRDNGT